ncbi:hypothetical protein [Mucilaginibacter sp. PAMB04168]|uniref:hypothetical protein n=1 Tax=Mucilaginibacter sp. PAMB04168 TaxID=3138567 RepID=UPI0031F705C0
MNTRNELAEANVNRWWRIKREEYNNGLLIAGAATFILLTCWIATVVNFSTEGEYIPIILFCFVVAYVIYMLIAHLLYTFGWVADVWLNHHDDENYRQMLFKVIYWASVVIPPLLILSAIIFTTYIFYNMPD